MGRVVRFVALVAVAIALSAADQKKAAGGPTEASNQQIATALDNLAASLKQPQKPSEHDQPCRKSDEDRASDLCAQWKAADAAKLSADATLWLGIVGSLIGAATLAAAVAAAIYARSAAHHTKLGAESYRARERAELVPALHSTAWVIEGLIKNVGPTKAVIHISNSALFETPPSPVPFIFPGHGRMSVALEGNDEFHFGKYDVPNLPVFYFVGAAIYETVFGDVELMPACFKIDISEMNWVPYYGSLDWSLWDAEVKKLRKRNEK